MESGSAATGQWKNLRRQANQPRQHVHELIFRPEDDRRAEHRPTQAARLDRVLGDALAVQEWKPRAAVGAVLRHEDYPLDVLHARSGNKSLRGRGIGVCILLGLLLDGDRRQVNDCAAAVERAPQRGGIAHVAHTKLDGQLAQRHCCLRRISDERAHLPPVFAQLAAGVNSDEAIGSGNEHGLFLVRRERLRLLSDCGRGSFALVRV